MKVLSDPHERAWYNDHKEDILRGNNATGDDATGGHTVNVWPFFSSSAYGGFDDKVDGFYTVYRQFFDKVVEEEKYIIIIIIIIDKVAKMRQIILHLVIQQLI